jgi:enoyl-CoA hydratase
VAEGTEHLQVEQRGTTLVVTMNRPEVKNALSSAMIVGMYDAWLRLDADDGLRCAILTGAGGAFCTGMDLKAAAGGGGDNPYADRWAAVPDLHWRALLRHHRPRKPVIAAIEGACVAGGTEIIQGTHIRVAGRSATFGVFEARRGLFPVGGSTVRLRRQVGYTKALEMLLVAKGYTATEALAMGLIGSLVDDGEALNAALELAELIGANGPLAVEAILRSVEETESMPEKEALARELEIGWPIFATEDAKEGPRAFAEKRKANFQRR